MEKKFEKLKKNAKKANKSSIDNEKSPVLNIIYNNQIKVKNIISYKNIGSDPVNLTQKMEKINPNPKSFDSENMSREEEKKSFINTCISQKNLIKESPSPLVLDETWKDEKSSANDNNSFVNLSNLKRNKICPFGKLNDSLYSTDSCHENVLASQNLNSISDNTDYLLQIKDSEPDDRFYKNKKRKINKKKVSKSLLNLLEFEGNMHYFKSYDVVFSNLIQDSNKTEEKSQDNLEKTDKKIYIQNRDFFNLNFIDLFLAAWINVNAHPIYDIKNKDIPIRLKESEDLDKNFSDLVEIFDGFFFAQKLFLNYLKKRQILNTKFVKTCLSLVFIKLGLLSRNLKELSFEKLIAMHSDNGIKEEYYVDTEYENFIEFYFLSKDPENQISFLNYNKTQIELQNLYHNQQNSDNKIKERKRNTRITPKLLTLIMDDILNVFQGNLFYDTPINIISKNINLVLNTSRKICFTNEFFYFEEMNENKRFKRFDYDHMFSREREILPAIGDNEGFIFNTRLKFEDLIEILPFSNIRLLTEEDCAEIMQFQTRMNGFKLCKIYMLKIMVLLLFRFENYDNSTKKDTLSLTYAIIDFAFQKLINAPLAFFQEIIKINEHEFPPLLWNKIWNYRKANPLKINHKNKENKNIRFYERLQKIPHHQDYSETVRIIENEESDISNSYSSEDSDTSVSSEDEFDFKEDKKEVHQQESTEEFYLKENKEEEVQQPEFTEDFDFEQFEELKEEYAKTVNQDELHIVKNMLKHLFVESSYFGNEMNIKPNKIKFENKPKLYDEILQQIVENRYEETVFDVIFSYSFNLKSKALGHLLN